MITTCPECGKEVSDTVKVCPHCGYKKPRSWLWLKLLLGIPVGLLVLGYMFGSNDGRSGDRASISTCWSEQARKSHDPAMARFVASTCEKMERDFRSKYGVSP